LCAYLLLLLFAVDRITRTENEQKQQLTTFEGHSAVFGQIRNMRGTLKN